MFTDRAVRAHPVKKLLQQTCYKTFYKSAAGLLQVVRFCVCSRCMYMLITNMHVLATTECIIIITVYKKDIFRIGLLLMLSRH